MKGVGGHRYRVGDLTDHHLDDEEGEGQQDHAGKSSCVGKVKASAKLAATFMAVSVRMTVLAATHFSVTLYLSYMVNF